LLKHTLNFKKSRKLINDEKAFLVIHSPFNFKFYTSCTNQLCAYSLGLSLIADILDLQFVMLSLVTNVLAGIFILLVAEK